ncbi:MAG: 2'-5' RNA ligase family protein [Saprospiraceae bacterium]|nr:2'-5' RNA ligase family protein [Saprospiraceae bacterium]HQW00857.1 2'-5' RNA ligase family protein [Saprospiraceae bacterium]HQW25744.1 2'-5' RNA ligase family protein [Saprospiraceae bacterium]
MNKGRRIQLTLFVDEKQSAAIEHIRQKFNPQQYGLIKAHVTLSREDEIESFDNVLYNLTSQVLPKISLCFGRAIRFSDGNGVFLPANENAHSFKALRSQILHGIIETPRNHEPHITLMHPRNSTCTDDIFQQISKVILPAVITFEKISLIEQIGQEPWKIIQEFDLNVLA